MSLDFFYKKTWLVGILTILTMQPVIAHQSDYGQISTATPGQPLGIGEDFSYISDEGKLSKLSSIDAKVTAIFFGYTNCIDVCPATLAKLAAVAVEAPFNQDEFKVLFVSVDLKNDQRLTIKNYLQLFGDNFIGGRLLPNEVEHISKQFGLYTQEIASNSERTDITHSSGIYLFDDSDQAVAYLSSDTDIETIVTTIQTILEN